MNWLAALDFTPPPARKKTKRGGPRAWLQEAKKLAPGESILLPYDRGAVASNAHRATGWKFTQRKEGEFTRLTRIE